MYVRLYVRRSLSRGNCWPNLDRSATSRRRRSRKSALASSNIRDVTRRVCAESRPRDFVQLSFGTVSEKPSVYFIRLSMRWRGGGEGAEISRRGNEGSERGIDAHRREGQRMRARILDRWIRRALPCAGCGCVRARMFPAEFVDRMFTWVCVIYVRLKLIKSDLGQYSGNCDLPYRVYKVLKHLDWSRSMSRGKYTNLKLFSAPLRGLVSFDDNLIR